MPWSWGMPSVLAFVVTTISTPLALAVWRHRHERYTGGFVAIVGIVAMWSFAYGVQLGFGARAPQRVWWQTTLAIAGTIPAGWLLFTLSYAGKDAWLNGPVRWLMIAEPVAFALLIFTNQRHGLIWAGFSVPPGTPVTVFAPEFAVGYYLHMAYAYTVITLGSGFVLWMAVRTSRLYRWQAIMLLIAVVPPFFSHVAFTLGVSPVPGLDLTPFAFGISVALLGVALFQFDLLDRTPIAREAALDVVGDGLVVLDNDGTIVDADERARRVLMPVPEPGNNVSAVFPDTPLSSLSGTTVEGAPEGVRRIYEVQVSKLLDAEDQPTGYALVLRDVTDRRAYEQRLEVANRVLRHNLRNDMNVVHGLAERIEAGNIDNPEAIAARIRAKAEDVVATSENVREMTRFEPSSGKDTKPVDLSTIGADVLDGFDCGTGTTVERDLSPDAVAAVADKSALVTALRNLLENAVEHNDDPDPWVRLVADAADDRAFFLVEDNGPGIPEDEQEVLRREAETPLKHSQGLGLWLASWCARAAGGELSIESTGEGGSTVRIEFPAAERE